MIKIEKMNLFKDRLISGINLFTGAGFSTLPDKSNKSLPTADELKLEVIEKFNLKNIDKNQDLEYVSEFCPSAEYQKFLRSRFTVHDYNNLYNVLNKINIKTVITTNIDNIIHSVMENSPNYYLSNIREYGASMGSQNKITYIPLHGDVTDINSKLYFSKFDLIGVEQDNKDLFTHMYSQLQQHSPVLFMGYSFRNNSVLEIVKKLIQRGHQDIWIQLLPTDKSNIRLFGSKGCKIIESDIESLLKWIDENINTKEPEGFKKNNEDTALKEFKIPSISNVPPIQTKDYYQHGTTGWHPILADVPYERSIVSTVEDAALKYKNVILSGNIFTGKTTALMQLARKVNSHNKYYVDNITKEQAMFIINKLRNHNSWVFFANCCNDTEAFALLGKCPNIRLVGTTEDYQLETAKHILDQKITYKIIDSNEIQEDEAKRIYNNIPEGIRQSEFRYKKTEDEKFSMLELIANNVVKAYTRNNIIKMLKTLYKEDKNYFTIIALAAYLTKNQSALSYVNVSNILDVKVYPDAVDITKKVKDFLRNYNLFSIEDREDFFVLRSKLFEVNVQQILIKEFQKQFAEIIKKFIFCESPYNILRYDIFKRKAYDSEFINSVFSKKEADSIYEYLYEKDSSPYTLQQWALCQSAFGDYTNAFINIDKALNAMSHNFSFKNSQAIILFESSKQIYSDASFENMKKAMSILHNCYMDDKRKLYHAQKYGEFSLYLYSKYDCKDYLETALKWLNEMSSPDLPDSIKTKRLKERLINIISRLV